MSKSHEGRVAIVTGAANGIGRAIALELGKRGAQMVLVDLEEAAETAAQIGGRTRPPSVSPSLRTSAGRLHS
jgi:NAD(P)-dependent dehydrogenase (short-subunit alcohol dehydrogenase family)